MFAKVPQLALPARLAASLILAGVPSILAQSPKSPEGIAVIKAYEGSWKVQIDTLDTPHSKAAHEETALRNDCWSSGEYFACNQYVDGDSKVLIVFTWQAAKGRYTSYQIPTNGGEAGSGTITIAGNTWIFPWEQTEEGKTTYYRVVNVWASPTHIDYRREFSTDKITWTVMARGAENKIK